MQNQQLFEAPFVSEVGTNYCSKCIRSGAGKCMCKRCQGEVPPPLNPRAYSKPSSEAQWLFEAPSVATHSLSGEYYSDLKSTTGKRSLFVNAKS